MSRRRRNKGAVWVGFSFAAIGLILVYFGVDFPNTNLSTFVYPELIGATLMLVGCFTLAGGLLFALWGYMQGEP
jgi:hypothetical protein